MSEDELRGDRICKQRAWNQVEDNYAHGMDCKMFLALCPCESKLENVVKSDEEHGVVRIASWAGLKALKSCLGRYALRI